MGCNVTNTNVGIQCKHYEGQSSSWRSCIWSLCANDSQDQKHNTHKHNAHTCEKWKQRPTLQKHNVHKHDMKIKIEKFCLSQNKMHINILQIEDFQ